MLGGTDIMAPPADVSSKDSRGLKFAFVSSLTFPRKEDFVGENSNGTEKDKNCLLTYRVLFLSRRVRLCRQLGSDAPAGKVPPPPGVLPQSPVCLGPMQLADYERVRGANHNQRNDVIHHHLVPDYITLYNQLRHIYHST